MPIAHPTLPQRDGRRLPEIDFVIVCRLRDQRNHTLRKSSDRQKLDLGPMGEVLSWPQLGQAPEAASHRCAEIKMPRLDEKLKQLAEEMAAYNKAV